MAEVLVLYRIFILLEPRKGGALNVEPGSILLGSSSQGSIT